MNLDHCKERRNVAGNRVMEANRKEIKFLRKQFEVKTYPKKYETRTHVTSIKAKIKFATNIQHYQGIELKFQTKLESLKRRNYNYFSLSSSIRIPFLYPAQSISG